jgi:hypothetical protein
MNRSLIVDYVGSFHYTPQQINEAMSNNGGKLILTGPLQRYGSTNQNLRVYPEDILKRESVKYKSTYISENRALGELDHPESSVVNLSNVSHNMLDLWWDGNTLMGKLEILPTPSGNIAKSLLQAGIKLGISSRGMGSVRELGEGKVEVQDDFEIICWDLVSNPSTQGAFMSPLQESANKKNVNASKYASINSLVTDIISLL